MECELRQESEESAVRAKFYKGLQSSINATGEDPTKLLYQIAKADVKQKSAVKLDIT